MYSEESFAKKYRFKKFNKSERSSFSYWFNHWKAFNLLAMELHVWRPKHLLHDIEKPWLRLFLPYEKVQHWHRFHNNHHIEWLADENHLMRDFDIVSMVIDNECSRFTKTNAKLTAIEYCVHCKNEIQSKTDIIFNKEYWVYDTAEKTAKSIGLLR